MRPVLLLAARHPAALGTAVACGCATTVVSLLSGATLRGLADGGAAGRGLLAWVLVGLGLGLAANAVLTYVREEARAAVARSISAELGSRVLRSAFGVPLGELSDLSPSDLVARFEAHRELRGAVTGVLFGAAVDTALSVIPLLALLAVDPRLCAVAILLLPGLPWIARATRRRLAGPEERAFDASCATLRRLVDGLVDPRSVRAFAAADPVRLRVEEALGTELDVEREVARVRAASSALAGLAAGAVLLGLLAAGVALVSRGAATVGDVLFAYTVVGTLLGPVEGLAQLGPSLERARVVSDRLEDLLARPLEPRGGAAPPPEGDLVLRDVGFAYAPGVAVLRRVDLVLPSGATVAIVGSSGSGKSTLLALLSGLYRPTGGAVLAGGTDLAEVDVDLWRRGLGIVLQRTTLWNDTVIENVRFGRPWVSREDALRALHAAQATEFVARLPAGPDTVVDGPDTLSGGQAQRIGLARALAGRPRWLLLDEATSSLDAPTEAAVLSAIRAARPAGGTVIVAHRWSAVASADLVVVLEEGRVVESGPPGVLRRCGGRLAELAAVQREAA